MPDQAGALSELERATATKGLKEHGAWDKPCPICGRPDTWGMAGHVVDIPVGHTFMPPGVYFPAIPILCVNCGYMRLHAAILMGIVGKNKPETEATNG